MIEFSLNGTAVAVDVDDDTPLAYALRNALDIKSVKIGCEAEQCGACHVIINGDLRTSCTTPVGEVTDAAVRTVEGLEASPVGAAIQNALGAHNATQCGVCLSGILMAATWLFEQRPSPTDADIRAALRGNLCRCGAQPRVLRALAAVASEAS